jgi:hypothetical protein
LKASSQLAKLPVPQLAAHVGPADIVSETAARITRRTREDLKGK